MPIARGQLGAEVIIRIDDDNFPFDATSFVDNHVARLFHTGDVELVNADNGWFNCCDMLEERNGLRFYPRGFPVLPRHQVQSVTVAKSTGLKIGVNAGLWLGDPDIDAHQRLAHPIDATKFSANYNEDLLVEKGVHARSTRRILPIWLNYCRSCSSHLSLAATTILSAAI